MSDVPAGKVPIFESIGVAFSYFAENWSRWIPAVIAVGLLLGVAQSMAIGAIAPAMNGGELNVGPLFLVQLLSVVVALVFTTSVLRHFIRGEFANPIGLSIGADEIRVLGMALALYLAFGIGGGFVALFLMILVMTAIGGAGVDLELAETDPDAFLAQIVTALGTESSLAAMLILLMLVLFAVVLFIYMRLILVQAATVGERRIMIFQTWSWTKGNFWRVFAAVMLMGLLVGIVSSIIINVFQFMLLGGSADDPAVLIGVSPMAMFAYGSLQGIVTAFGSILTTALVAHLYLGLRPGQPVSKTFE